MSDREHHCPFLNRSDHRCSGHFSMQGMQHAFEHCFDAYKACGVYRELLAERQARRGQAPATAGMRFLWATACQSPAAEAASDVSSSQEVAPGNPSAVSPRSQFVQLRLPGNIAAAAAAVSAALAIVSH